MKKNGVLNQALSEVIAGMGHGDMLVIGDAGLPIPAGVRRIDLALTANVPGFIITTRTILTELQVENAVIASEMSSISPDLHAELLPLIGNVPMTEVSHMELKQMTRQAVAVIRTGEFTPYANIILKSGVIF